jgi:hypothetical protein
MRSAVLIHRWIFIVPADLDEFIACYNPENRHKTHDWPGSIRAECCRAGGDSA